MADWNPLTRVANLRKAKPVRKADDDPLGRVPPGQYLTTKFPVLTYGETPNVNLEDWRLKVWGLVENPIELNWEEFRTLPGKEIICDLHCVTRWSQLGMKWEGVAFSEIAKLARPKPDAKFVMEHSYGGYTTNVPLDELYDDDVLIAYNYDGKPLPTDHGGPVRMLVPKLYLWKSAKWLRGLEFMPKDKPGFWEMYGYHHHGDPWTEERFG
ncbi:MAG: sulfite oxidase-like oxidoreductase [candidate division KSB1 bacterium]|nr:sulfite oxidase-like oxidoreductase [candidate division KSB1 bacterium]MDZ7367736.1 sulfite oxidase-like oxidoreductase [candidate division KSB1 bacterium]MDZ7406298.1 sulfite oxidase-like oxidoreductase [candidate division KSB1 bacterium]